MSRDDMGPLRRRGKSKSPKFFDTAREPLNRLALQMCALTSTARLTVRWCRINIARVPGLKWDAYSPASQGAQSMGRCEASD